MRTTTIAWCRRAALALLLAGCATAGGGSTAGPAIIVSAEAVATLGDHFAAIGAFYQANCKPPKVAQLAGFCAGFADYGPKFQQAYPTAVATLKAARAGNDTAKAQGAEATVVQLSTQLTQIAAQAFLALSK